MRGLYSVVVPTFNRGKVISRCINSVLNQTYRNIELIIIDDGSKDNTMEIVEEFSDSRVRYIYQENAGAQVARNHGLCEAKGEYISFLDSDDEWLPQIVERFVEEFEKDSEVDCVYCQSGLIRDGALVYAHRDRLQGKEIYKETLEQGYITSPTFMAIRLEKMRAIGEWDVSLKASQDDDICFRIAKAGYKIKLIDEILAIYHDDGDNKIMSDQKRLADAWYVLWSKYEADTIRLCGRRVMAKHFGLCYSRYALCNDSDGMKKSILKVRKYDFLYATKVILKNKIKELFVFKGVFR